MLFHVGRHSRFGWPVIRMAYPNWFCTRTFHFFCVDSVIRKHPRCAAGLVILYVFNPLGVSTVFCTGLQCTTSAGLIFGTKPFGTNWLIRCTGTVGTFRNLPDAV